MTRQIHYWGFVLRTYPPRELHSIWPHYSPTSSPSLLSIECDTELLGAAVNEPLLLVGFARFFGLPLACDRRRRPGVGKYARWA